MDSKEEFYELFYEYIERDGSEKLLEWLERSDFFTAPASTRLHSSVEGGLCAHSVKTFKRFLRLVQQEYGKDWQSKKGCCQKDNN